jgi:hypothetical protein
LNNFKTLIDTAPDKFKDLKKSLDELTALDYCDKWVIHRRWLQATNVDFKDFPEEILFQEHAERFNFA